MDAIDADGFPVDFEQHLLNLLKEDAAAAADTSAKGPANVLANGLANVAANVFDREFTKAQQFEAGIYVPNSVESQGFNNVTGPVPSGAQFNQQQPATQLSIPQLPIPVVVSPRGESVDSLFDAPSSPGLRVTQTPSTSPEVPSVAMQIPISTPSKKKPKKNCTPRSKAGSITTEMVSYPLCIDPLPRRCTYNVYPGWPQDPQFRLSPSSSRNCQRIFSACLSICAHQSHPMCEDSTNCQPA